jgi:hypothetical protein
MKFRIAYVGLFALLFPLFVLSLTAEREKAGPIARYTFDEGLGSRVSDSSGHQNDGTIVGGAHWVDGIRGKALLFDGVTRVSIPSSAKLNLAHGATVVAWVRGRGEDFRIVREPSTYSSVRGPFFQVCGDTIYLATNSDHSAKDDPQLSADPTLKKHPGFPWNDWQLWTGTADISLANWRDTQRTKTPYSGLEPKLQVVGDEIYFEYFGQDPSRAWQIWTARSKADGSGWSTTQRTFEKEGYRVEQEGNLQVVGGQVFDGWPEKDEKDNWQLWTATSRRDGSGFRAIQRTFDSGWIPNIQVVGDKVYYMYPTIRFARRDPSRKNTTETLTFAKSDKNGHGWQILHKFNNSMLLGWGAFQVNKGRIYFSHGGLDDQRALRLFTGSMNVDGSDFQETQRTFGKGFASVPHTGLQVIGNRVYYAFGEQPYPEKPDDLFSWTDAEFKQYTGKMKMTTWTASANLDGSDWKQVQRTDGSSDISFGYRSIYIVGAKSYFGAMEELSYPDATHTDRMHPLMATAGSNVVNKGDAYGIGVTEFNDARAFVNAGEDYLFRGEAPEDTAGTTADSAIDDAWHELVMTYDRNTVSLYVDGEQKSASPSNAEIGSNPFPLLIGDGFKGAIDEVSIYERALTPAEIRRDYQQVKR